MIEGLTHVMTPKPQAQASESESDETMESVALAGAAAIQRLIADRDNLRTRANAQQRELVALSAINEDLRRRVALIRHHYVELGTKILTQLEQFDQATRDAMQDNQHTAPASSEDANLVALAHRLRPTNGPR
jgi:predicted  nucleic acid-binding Zn-ribbon protein